MVTCQCGLQRLPSLKLDRLRRNGAPCGLRRADGLETCLLRPQQETGPRVVRSRLLLRPADLWSINGGRPFSFMLALRSSNSCPRIPSLEALRYVAPGGMEQTDRAGSIPEVRIPEVRILEGSIFAGSRSPRLCGVLAQEYRLRLNGHRANFVMALSLGAYGHAV